LPEKKPAAIGFCPGPVAGALPELPEVETIRRGLEGMLRGRRITHVDFREAKRLRSASPRPLAELAGQRIVRLRRHGKFLLLDLDRGGTLLIHLGMTGKTIVLAAGAPERPHTHLVLRLDDGRELRFSDARRFGTVRLYGPGEPIVDLAHYGPDALSRAFTVEHLGAGLAASRAPLKAFLLDQRKVAGIGNIYACEAMWRAGLSPRRTARRVPKAKVPVLHAAVRDVLKESIGRGGTSFNDYVDAIGREGDFVAELAVFQREGEPCPRCGAPIRRMVQSGRSTFHCAACQK
jgi:formamidopyrimidine-DNA glycosylase